MTLSKRDLAALLMAFADALNEMNDDDFRMLVSGSGRFVFTSVKRASQPAQEPDLGQHTSTIVGVAQKLREATTREEARQVLNDALPGRRRAELVDLARLLRVHQTKADSIDSIEERIIDSVVGTKIRSRVLQELPL